MKTGSVWAAAGLLLMALTSGAASAQSAAFTLSNNTGFTVYSVYFWPTEADYRGRDRLGDDTIVSGSSHTFTPRDGECMYDIRVTLDNDGGEKQWDDVNLCELSTLTLNYNFMEGNLWASRD